MLTIQIAAKNDDSLDETLRSVESLNAEIQIIPSNTEEPRDILRNRYASMAKNDWILLLEPWETLVQGHESILTALSEPMVYRIRIIQQTLIVKEPRLWHRGTGVLFSNPIHETLTCRSTPLLHKPVIFSRKTRHNYIDDQKVLEAWMSKSPLSSEPYYYRSCALLAEGKYKEFLAAAEAFLFHQNEGVSAVMTRYYMGTVRLCVFGDVEGALADAARCLAAYPLMSEFWCLAGDALYRARQYERAETMYGNGMIIGDRRLDDDYFPVDVSKYREHPERMILSCKEMASNTVLLITPKG